MLHVALEYKLHGDSSLLTLMDPCASAPFTCERFIFDGIDRGLQVKSAFQGSGFPEIVIFVEKPGPPFLLDGPHAGEARQLPRNQNK